MVFRAPSLILMCGLPGSGKTTLAKQIEKETKAIRLSPDEWIYAIVKDISNQKELDRLRSPVEKLQRNFAVELLKKKVTVILEWGFWSQKDRTAWLNLAQKVGANVELYFFNVNVDNLWKRISKRNKKSLKGTFKVTRKQIMLWSKLFQAPTQKELKYYSRWKMLN